MICGGEDREKSKEEGWKVWIGKSVGDEGRKERSLGGKGKGIGTENYDLYVCPSARRAGERVTTKHPAGR